MIKPVTKCLFWHKWESAVCACARVRECVRVRACVRYGSANKTMEFVRSKALRSLYVIRCSSTKTLTRRDYLSHGSWSLTLFVNEILITVAWLIMEISDIYWFVLSALYINFCFENVDYILLFITNPLNLYGK